jgi:RNase H-fold protein (predicted Holliday junction resolvase)
MLGLAIFQNHSLIDYSLKLHKEMWSPQKRDSVIASLASCIEHYTITAIAVSIPDPHQQTKGYTELQEAIESFAHVHGIPVTLYTAKDLYQHFGNPAKRTREALMKRLSLLIPELTLYYEREQANRNKYYIKLFEAISAAAYHSLGKRS